MSYNILSSSDGVQIQRDKGIREILIDSSADLANVPTDTAPGSVAYTADMSYIAMKANDGTWKQIGGGA